MPGRVKPAFGEQSQRFERLGQCGVAAILGKITARVGAVLAVVQRPGKPFDPFCTRLNSLVGIWRSFSSALGETGGAPAGLKAGSGADWGLGGSGAVVSCI